jgi:two-component system phosphate regulon sensor histidine kinase PhoR
MRTTYKASGTILTKQEIEIETLKVKPIEKNFRETFLTSSKPQFLTVQGYIDTLIEVLRCNPQKYLARAQKGVERLTHIVNDMDMITKLEIK